VRAGLWGSFAAVLVAAFFLVLSGAWASRESLPQTAVRHQCGLVPRGFTCSSATRVRFAYPSGWHAARYLVSSSFDRSLSYLSTAPPRDPCVTTQEGSGTKVSCGWQVSKLEAEGVAAKWLGGDRPGWNIGSVPGKVMRIGGRPARFSIATTGPLYGACHDIGGEEVVAAWIGRRARGFYAFIACVRGPGMPQRESDIRLLLKSVKFPYG
jgi:hypothetical protein